MDNGERCRVDDVNLVTVIAQEAFAKFAGDLQKEIEDETGVSFDGRITDLKRDKIQLRLKDEVLGDPIFQQLWSRIARKTTYQLEFDTDKVVSEAVRRINEMDQLQAIKFRITKVEVDIRAEGVVAGSGRERGQIEVDGARRLPDVVGELSRRVPLSRATIVRILKTIDNISQVTLNPAVFVDQVSAAMNEALYVEVAKGITYTPVGDERWSADLFVSSHQAETVAKADFVVPVSKSVTDKLVCDSKIEVAFARFLEEREDVPIFIKLPGWFLIPTPLGSYNPDWAFARREKEGHYLYLVRETKGTDKIEDLQWETEGWKIKFGEAHFKALKVDYFFHNDPAVLIQFSSDFPQHSKS
jgi:type III restriction enzyme